MKINNFLILFFITAGLLVLLNNRLVAQEGRQKPKTEASTQQKPKKPEVDLKKKRKELKIFLDKIEILGRVEKPQTVFILPGNDPKVDDIQIDRSFFQEIFRSIEKDDFPRGENHVKKAPIIW